MDDHRKALKAAPNAALRGALHAALVAAALFAWPIAARAHGSVTDRLTAIDRALAERPNEATLYEERGQLNLLAQNYTQAALDFEEAHALEPDRPGLAHRWAKALLELGDDRRAAELATRALEADPEHLPSRLLRARALVGAGDLEGALVDYDHILERAPSPQTYHERAEALARHGRLEEAMAGLRAALDRLGPLATLIELGIEVEERRGDRAAALALIDRLPSAMASSPKWLVRRGELLEASGRLEEAQASYRRALDALAALPSGRAEAPAFRATAALAEAGVVRLTSVEVVDEPRRPWQGAIWAALGAGFLALGWLLRKRLGRAA